MINEQIWNVSVMTKRIIIFTVRMLLYTSFTVFHCISFWQNEKKKKKKNLVLLPACSAIPCKNVYIHWTINKAYHIFSCLLRTLMANICFFTNVTTGLIFYLYLCVCAIYTNFFQTFFFSLHYFQYQPNPAREGCVLGSALQRALFTILPFHGRDPQSKGDMNMHDSHFPFNPHSMYLEVWDFLSKWSQIHFQGLGRRILPWAHHMESTI